ncbi:MAG: hypothetical protein ACI4U2_02870, partial [Christensenellaceae bacterium]
AFWHERNGLRFVDSIELLADNYNLSRNLNLTYAVRDGIISHCGEVDGNGLRPREEYIDLARFEEAGQYEPATWEGCVVKLADKIAYVGRDIEDAKSLGLLSEEAKRRLLELARINDQKVMNTTVIMHNLIIDVCQNSSVDRGICLSDAFCAQLNEVKRFNYQYIYGSKRFRPFIHYSTCVLRELFEFLYGTYDRDVLKIWANLSENRPFARQLVESFEGWLARYVDPAIVPDRLRGEYESCRNRKIYGRIEDEKTFARAVIDFIAGMTDRFAVNLYEELLNY